MPSRSTTTKEPGRLDASGRARKCFRRCATEARTCGAPATRGCVFRAAYCLNGMASRAPEHDRRESPVISQAGEMRSARLESLRAVAALLVLEGHVFGWSKHYRAQDIY